MPNTTGIMWAALVVTALLILTGWSTAYALLAAASIGICFAIIRGSWKKNSVARSIGCGVTGIVAWELIIT